MSDIIDFPAQRDLVEEMKGPDGYGTSVIIEGHCIPNLTMIDRGEEIEFVLDHRMSWTFPREVAWNAASFAATAMAIGAGHPHFSAPHKSTKPFATPTKKIEIVT